METKFDFTNEVLHIDDYKGGFVVFDDMLDTYQKTIDLFFTRAQHKVLDVHFFSKFRLFPSKNTKNSSNIKISNLVQTDFRRYGNPLQKHCRL